MKRVGWYQDQDGQGRSPPVQIWRMGSPPPRTISFCGCSLTQLSRNSKGRTGEFENPDLINYVFCLWLRVQWLHNLLQKDRFNIPQGGFGKSNLILNLLESDDRADNRIWWKGNKSINCDTWPSPLVECLYPSPNPLCVSNKWDLYLSFSPLTELLQRWPNNNVLRNESTQT